MNTSETETTPRADRMGDRMGDRMDTSSGIKIDTTAKGYLQPGFTLRYASATEALVSGVEDWCVLFDQFVAAAHERGLTVVTDLSTSATSATSATEGK